MGEFKMEEKPKSKIYNITFISEYGMQEEKGQPPSEPDKPIPIFKKLTVLYFWVFFLYFGLHSAIYAQNYLVQDQNLGIATLITVNATRTIATLFLGYVIWKIPLNWIMLLGSFFQVFYVIASFCPSWYTLIPSAIFSGIGSSGMGIAAYIFMATIGKHFEKQSKMDGYRLQTRIFLLYNVVVQLAIIAGYFVSYGVLGRNAVANANMTDDDTLGQFCGKDYCGHQLSTPKTGPAEDTLTKQYWLCGLCMISIMSAFMILLFLEPLSSAIVIPAEKRDANQTKSSTKLTIIQFLLFPGNIITAVGSSFWFLDVTTAFKKCMDDPYYLMDNFLIYAVSFILAAILFGWYTHRYVRGQLGIFLSLKIAVLITLILYTKIDDALLLGFTSLWAISDGVLSPGFPAMYGTLCPDKLMVAFTSQQFWTSFGYFMVDLLSIEICMSPKLYIHSAFAVLALTEYIVLECAIRKKS